MRQGVDAATPGSLLRDERCGETIGWALGACLIVVAIVAVAGAVGTNVPACWQIVDDRLRAVVAAPRQRNVAGAELGTARCVYRTS